MKSSKLSILLLFLVMILAISAVSAADTNETSDSAVQAVDEAPVEEVASADVDAVAATDDAPVLSAGGQNFTQLQTAVDTGMVLMSDDYVRQAGENTISVNKDVTIMGNDHKIDGNNLGGIFNVNSGYTLTLIGVTLINGNATNGGAIYNNGTLTIVNSNFLNNTATNNGAAIYNNGGSITVTGSTFDGNDLTKRNVNGNGGAAIYTKNGNVLISTSTISNNLKNIVHRGGTGTYEGDLISAAVSNDGGTLTVTDSYFEKNSGSYGGAILSQGAASTLTVSGSTFENNFAFTGGAIYCPDGNYLITSSNFTGNKVRGTGSATGTWNNKNYLAHGGAIAATETAECIISDCIFKNNSASVGGAISTKNTKVVGCTFINNSAEAAYSETVNGNPNNVGGFGAAVYSDSVMTIDDSTFINNTNTRNDGLYLRNATVTDSSFTNTIISVNKGPLTISNNTYDNKGVDISGGNNPSIYFDGVGDAPKTSGSYIYCNATSFTSLQAMIDTDPYRIYLTGDVTKLASEEEAFANGILINVDTYIDLQGHTITSNNGKVFTVNESGSLSLYNGNVVGDGTSAIVNKGTVTLSLTTPATFTNVGEFAIDNQGTIKAKEKLTTFTQLNNLIALISGGEIYLNQYRYEITKTDAEKDAFANGIVIDKNLTIRGIVHSSRGIDTKINANNDGRIFTVTNGATLTLQKVILQNGNATNGGAVYVEVGAALNADTVEFNNNIARDKGGAIYSEGTVNINHATIKDNDITNRTANNNDLIGGAAIYNKGTLAINDTKVSDNLKGFANDNNVHGAIFTTGTTNINNSYISNSYGRWGGAITIEHANGPITIENTIFEDNFALFGGAIDNEGSSLYVDNCKFYNNTADGEGSPGTTNAQGGAILVQGTTSAADIRNSEFINNSATVGGAISITSLTSGNFNIYNCNFTDNEAKRTSNTLSGQGGVIYYYTSPDSNMSISESKFTGNKAVNGGAIYDSGRGEVSVSKSDFINNNATNAGGAIYAYSPIGSVLDITESNFENNSAIASTICVYNTPTNLSISKSNFTENYNIYDYGVVFVDKGTGNITIDEVNFTNVVKGSVSVDLEGPANLLIKNSYLNTTNSYAIWSNNGNISLENNDITSALTPIKIIGNGKFVSEVKANISGNNTYNTHLEEITVTINLTDDSNNVIQDANIRFIVYKDDKVVFNKTATFNTANKIYTGSFTPTEPGAYLVTVDYPVKDVATSIYIISASLYDLNTLISNANNGDTITLGFDYAYIEEYDAGLKNGIVIDKNIIINGNGSTICGNNSARIFNVTNGATLTLSNVTLCHGNATYGGAVYVEAGAALNVDAVNFNDNTAKLRGGAIWSAGTVDIKNSAFDSNNITYRNENKDYGGAAIYSKGDLTVDNTRFTNDLTHYVVRYGDENNPHLIDAVVLAGGGTAYINNSYFENNSGSYGGAVAALPIDGCSSVSLTVENSEFFNNLAYCGAAIYAGSGTTELKVKNCTFIGNNATGIGSKGYTSAGGAISINRDTTATITDSKFINNTATVGGAVDVSATSNSVAASIDNCYFENNVATGSPSRDAVGGAIRVSSTKVSGDKLVVSVENSNFTDNVAAAGGSAIYNNGTLSLSGNKVFSDKTEIESVGTITTTIYAIFLDGKDVPAELGETVYPTAKLTDGYNLIYDHTFNITVDDVEYLTEFNEETGLYNATYVIATACNHTVSTNYAANITKGKYVVDRANVTSFMIDVLDIVQGENATVEIVLVGVNDEGLNATVTVYVNNKPIAITVQDGYGSQNVSGLDAGQYPVFAQFNDVDGNYNTAYNSTVFYVKSTQAVLDVDIEDTVYGETFTIYVDELSDMDGNPLNGIVVVDIAGNTYNIAVVNGTGSLEVTDIILNVTDDGYDWTATFENELYNTTSETGTLTIIPKSVYLDVRTYDGVAVGEEGQIKVIFYDDDNVYAGEEVELIFTNETGDIVAVCKILTSDEVRGPVGSDILEFTKYWKIGMYYVSVKSQNFIFEQSSEDEDDEDEAPAYYQFTSYAVDGTEWGTGVAVVIDDPLLGYIPVKVVSNSFSDEFVDEVFYIEDYAVADGESLYELFDANAVGTGIYVKVSPAFEYPVHKKAIDAVVIEGDGEYVYGGEHIVVIELGEYGDYYGFTSYGDEACTIEYGTGIVEVDDRVGKYISVKVMSNDFDDRFVGQTFYVLDDEYGEDEPVQLHMMNDNDEIVPVDLWVKVSELRGYYKLINITCPATVEVYRLDDDVDEYIKTIETSFEDGRLSIDLSGLETGDYILKVQIDDATYELHSHDYDRDIEYPYALLYTDDYLFRVVEDHVYVNNVNGTDWTQYGDERIFNFELWHHYWIDDDEVDELFVYNTTAGVIIYKVVRDEHDVILSIDELDSYVVNITDGISGSINLTYLGAGEYKVTVMLNDTNYTIEGWDEDAPLVYEYTSYNEDGTVEYGSGTVEVIGDAKDGFIPVVVILNLPDGSFDGQLFYIKDDADEKGEFLNQLYRMDDNNDIVPVDIWVTVSKFSDKDTPYYAEHFNVDKANVEVNVTVVGQITYGENETVTVTVVTPTGEKLNETVEVNVMGKESFNVTLANGTVTFNLTGYDVGTYTIWVNFFGNDNYWDSYNNIYVFDVAKADPSLDPEITPEPHVYGEETTVTVNVGEGATNFVVFSLDGDDYVVDINNGVATKSFIGLAAGPHTLIVRYGGDDNYKAGATDGTAFEIANATAEFKVIEVVNPTIYPGDVYVTVESSVAGKVTIYVGTEEYQSFNVEAGVTTLNVSGLPVGVYVNNTAVFEADNYDSVNSTFSFEVATITIDPKDVNVTLTGDYPDGVITVESLVNGTYNVRFVEADLVVPVEVKGGSGSAAVGNLTAGNYNVTVGIADVSYSLTKEDKLAYYQAPEFNATISGTYPTGVILINGTPGNYKVIIDGVEGEFYVTVLDMGIGSKTINIAAGNYTAEVTFIANGTYHSDVKYIDFTIDKATPEFTVNVNVTADTYPGAVNITITGANGVYNITIGEIKDNITVENGTASKVISGLSAGDKTLITVLPANGSYAEVTKENPFTINKAEINPVVSADESVEFGKAYKVEVAVPEDYTGSMIVEIDGKNYAVGEDISLPMGTYNVKVIFSEDANYTGTVVTKQVTVTKDAPAESAINVTVPENTTSPTFSIDLKDENATGYLLVDINGEHYYAPVVNGTASVTVPPLASGNYTANVTYTGDDKYAKVTKQLDVNVTSSATDNALDIPTTSETSSPTFSVNLPSDAGGYLEVIVDGKKYYAGVENGTASVTVPGLSEGSHNVTVIYSGDDKYPKVSKDATVNVHIPVYKLKNNKNVAVIYSASASYKVLVTKDGKAVGAGQSVVFTFNGKTTTVKTDKNGYATLKLNTKVKAKKYTVTAKYKGVTVKNTVNVRHVAKAKFAKIKKSKKVNYLKVKTNKVNGKFLKGKKLIFKVKGKKVVAKINKKGVVTFKLTKRVTKKLKVGKTYKYSITYGKDKIVKKLKVKK